MGGFFELLGDIPIFPLKKQKTCYWGQLSNFIVVYLLLPNLKKKITSFLFYYAW